MEPAAFAAELISRLEKLQLELESRHTLEERLQQIREVVLAPPCPAPPPQPLPVVPPANGVPPSAVFSSRMKRRKAPSKRWAHGMGCPPSTPFPSCPPAAMRRTHRRF